ncbi:MAG: SPOR domain-containing protein [Bacteroidales bacterium]|nr:SPOR domain-containing protein [Bacteroidales bacterium]
MRLITIIIFLFMAGTAFSQNMDEGKVKVISDARLDTLMQTYIGLNEINPGIEGWRIEIYFEAGNNSKKLAMEAKSEFVENYPEVPAYLLFQQPYYKVRVGDYKTKMEAEKFLNEIEQAYPNAFVVNDEINFPKLD